MSRVHEQFADMLARDLTLVVNRLLEVAQRTPVHEGGVEIHGAANGWRVKIRVAKTSIEVEGHGLRQGRRLGAQGVRGVRREGLPVVMTHKHLLATMTQLEMAVWAASYVHAMTRDDVTADQDAAAWNASIVADKQIALLRAASFKRCVADELAANKSRHQIQPNGICRCGFRPPDDETLMLHLNHVGALGADDIDK